MILSFTRGVLTSGVRTLGRCRRPSACGVTSHLLSRPLKIEEPVNAGARPADPRTSGIRVMSRDPAWARSRRHKAHVLVLTDGSHGKVDVRERSLVGDRMADFDAVCSSGVNHAQRVEDGVLRVQLPLGTDACRSFLLEQSLVLVSWQPQRGSPDSFSRSIRRQRCHLRLSDPPRRRSDGPCRAELVRDVIGRHSVQRPQDSPGRRQWRLLSRSSWCVSGARRWAAPSGLSALSRRPDMERR